MLGTVDRPSLHDIVRDYVIMQHSKDKLKDAHFRLVNCLRSVLMYILMIIISIRLYILITLY